MLSLTDLYGADIAYTGRFHPRAALWIPRDPSTLELLSGSIIVAGGETPIICSAGVATIPALGVMRDAGLAVAPKLHTFHTIAEFEAQLQEMAKAGHRIVAPYALPVDVVAPEHHYLPGGLISFLNNKANLGELVPPALVPDRALVDPAELVAFCRGQVSLPVVVKAASDDPSGGGVDVVICRSRNDLERAARFFESCRKVVVEDFIEIEKNFCLNYAATHDERIVYLGAAEQVSDAYGDYHGNWIDPASAPPQSAIDLGRAIAETGARLGYRGYLGVDMAIPGDGRVLVFDLNFRLNGSTVPLMVHADLARISATRVARVRGPIRIDGTSTLST